MNAREIPGYGYGRPDLEPSPLTMHDLDLLQRSVLFAEDDIRYLRMSRAILADQVEDVLDVWYGFVASHPHLVHYFSRRQDGQPDADYLSRVRARFGQWILDTTSAHYDQGWLDYQHEIALRHHRSKKNRTDGVDSAEVVPLRYLIAFIFPITATLRPFLANKGNAPEEVDRMHDAWRKSVILQVALWSQPYVPAEDY
jgi:hypothetical protein